MATVPASSSAGAAIVIHLDARSAQGDPANEVARGRLVQMTGHASPGQLVAMSNAQDGVGGPTHMARVNRFGQFHVTMLVHPGINALSFSMAGQPQPGPVTMNVVYEPVDFARSFEGSPTPPMQPFTRIIPNSQSYGPNAPTRPDARAISLALAEDPNHPAYSPNIELGLVFFGQFVDHDLNFNLTETGQGPSVDPSHPINLRTPALDLDPVYGGGPVGSPQFYTPDGLFFELGAGGNGLLRDANGVAIIGDPRNDDNGLVSQIHLSFQKYHNLLMTQALDGVDPATLDPAQKEALFNSVHDRVVAYYQGIVTHEFGAAILGRPISDHVAPIANVPAEFDMAVFRMGHSLVPSTIVVDPQGDRMSPTDPNLRGPDGPVPLSLLLGPHAQPAAALDNKISDTMRTLLIPLSPTSPGQGDLIGGNSANIGQGQIIDGVMHLDLGETNILRGREVHLPSGEEYLAMLEHRRYNPQKDGNTDLFVYILDEATPLGHLGRVGSDVVERTIGGLLAADPNRYDSVERFTPEQINAFRHATFEGLLHAIGTPGF